MIQYHVTRNVPATNEAGDDHLIALVLIKYPSGASRSLAINEALIQFQKEWDDPTGDRLIEREVRAAVGVAEPVLLV